MKVVFLHSSDMFSVFTGSSTHPYIRGSFVHQLNKELDNIRNQRNKLGKYVYVMYFNVWLLPLTCLFLSHFLFNSYALFLPCCFSSPIFFVFVFCLMSEFLVLNFFWTFFINWVCCYYYCIKYQGPKYILALDLELPWKYMPQTLA